MPRNRKCKSSAAIRRSEENIMLLFPYLYRTGHSLYRPIITEFFLRFSDKTHQLLQSSIGIRLPPSHLLPVRSISGLTTLRTIILFLSLFLIDLGATNTPILPSSLCLKVWTSVSAEYSIWNPADRTPTRERTRSNLR